MTEIERLREGVKALADLQKELHALRDDIDARFERLENHRCRRFQFFSAGTAVGGVVGYLAGRGHNLF